MEINLYTFETLSIGQISSPPPYNVELWPCIQRCGQHCAGRGGGGTISFHYGCLHKIIIKWLYQIVRHDRFYKSLPILFP